ncbi:hypothetical protein F4815DRAFT_459998 [Daldinia loculata]|nr:hypothetical protein F4815DRAFT_459998 [Daldinia loculata]
MPPGPIAGPSAASCSPAPYGQACVACSRAKCKCFYRSDGSSCERCHRLGKTCEPTLTARKRKAHTPPLPQSPVQHSAPTGSTRLEEKLDELVSLLRSQAAEKQAQQHTPESLPGGALAGYTDSMSPTPVSIPVREHPDIAIDTTATIVHLLRPSTPTSPSPIFDDVSVHKIPEAAAEELLDSFRNAFIPMCPVVHIPISTSSAELRRERPFLWLVIMALTSKMISQQFQMADTIWRIISHRVVLQHIVDMDLLLGIVCFATWSHHLKEDKPFMCMLSQLAVSLALELNIHHDTPTRPLRRNRFPTQRPVEQRPRTIEERRTMLAVFHLTSSTWLTYRQTEPLRWTSYLDDCLRILEEEKEAYTDIFLTTQVRCQIISNQLTCSFGNQPAGVESPKAASTALITALLRELGNIRRNLPAEVESNKATQFYLCFAEIKIRETVLYRPRIIDQTGASQFQRLQDLDIVLSIAERWISILNALPYCEWHGITADLFTQFTQYLVVLFRLQTLDEPGWDQDEVRRRADVFGIIDQACIDVDHVPVSLGMVDAEGPRSGFFFKMSRLLREVRALFLAEMPQNTQLNPAFPAADNMATGDGINTGAGFGEDMSLADEIYLNTVQEDILAHIWDFRPDGSYMSFAS